MTSLFPFLFDLIMTADMMAVSQHLVIIFYFLFFLIFFIFIFFQESRIDNF